MKTNLTRFRPNGLNETLTDAFGIEVFYSTELKKAIFYAGNSSKSWWFFRFGSIDEMIERIYKSVDNQIRIETEKLQKKEAHKKVMETFKASDYFSAGDIIVNTWGWEQTNVNFYQVVDVLNKKIRVKEIGAKIAENSMYSHGMACELVPAKDSFLENGRKTEYLLSLKADINKAGEISARICNPESYYYFRKWDGRSEYCSWYA